MKEILHRFVIKIYRTLAQLLQQFNQSEISFFDRGDNWNLRLFFLFVLSQNWQFSFGKRTN